MSALFLIEFFAVAFFLDCLWLYSEFVVKHFSSSLFIVMGWFIVTFLRVFMSVKGNLHVDCDYWWIGEVITL